METVKGVSNLELLSGTIRGKSNSSHLLSVKDKQISPLPYLAIKFIASGVANSAATTKSPSFSLSSSSVKIINLPCFISSIASSTFFIAESLISPPNSLDIAIFLSMYFHYH